MKPPQLHMAECGTFDTFIETRMNEDSKPKKMSGKMNFVITPPRLKTKRRIDTFLLILKPLMCVLCPLVVPAILYSFEGCTTLFWWSLGISIFCSLSLLILNTQKANEFMEYYKINQNGGYQCIIKLGLLLLVFGGSIYAFHEKFYEIFGVCLFICGIITGTFYTDVSAWRKFRMKKNLPYVNFTKSSPTPVFSDLRRKSLNVAGFTTNILPLKRQLSSPLKKSFNPINFPPLEVVSPVHQSDTTPDDFISPALHGYPSTSSSSGESDGPDVALQPSDLTPTKKRVISAGLISLSPLRKTPETEPAPKRRLELSRHIPPAPEQPSNISHLQTTPTFTYTECSVENLLSQNFSFFHM